MTIVAVASTALRDSEAGADLATLLRLDLNGEQADAILVFASSRNDYHALLQSLHDGCQPRTLIGCS